MTAVQRSLLTDAERIEFADAIRVDIAERGPWLYLGLYLPHSAAPRPIYEHKATGERTHCRPADYVDVPGNDLTADPEAAK